MKTRVMKQAKASFEKLMMDMISLVYLSNFLLRARQHVKDFTRRRKRPFANLMFFLLHQHTVSSIYSVECGWNTWHGYTVMAIDSSKTQLPYDPTLLEAFGGTGAGAKAPTAQASLLYDPLNDIIVDAKLAPLSTDERTLAKEHLMALSKFSIALDALDMGVDPFDFPCDDGSTIPLVAVKLTLDSGETELLLTSIGEAQEIIDDSSDDTSKYCYKANVNHAIGVYKDAFIAVVLEPDSVKFIWRLCKIVQLLAKGKTPVRPNRSVPRKPHPRDANFHHNRKSNA